MDKMRRHVSIKNRIRGSFFILVLVFIVNGIITIVTLNKSKKLSDYISKVIDPAQQARDDFEDILVLSKMYSTNWVFLRSNQVDKDALSDLQTKQYPKLKLKIQSLYTRLQNQRMADSVNKIFTDFEQLISIERKIMLSLQAFSDYDDPVKKMEAEQIVEDEIIPRTAVLINKLARIAVYEREAKQREFAIWETQSNSLRIYITVLALSVMGIAIVVSKYFTSIIISPINKIKNIVTDLGRGITRKIDNASNKDEIGEMILSVNHLSEKLEQTANFAEEIGKRNFNATYTLLSDEDTLGKALLTMREKIQTGEEELTQTALYLIKRNKDLEQFSYIVSHNLRAPLANISGITELLQLSDFGNSDEKDLVGKLADSVGKLDNVIMDLNDILQLQYTEGKEKEIVKFSELVADIKLSIDNLISTERVHINGDFSAIDEMHTIKSYLYSIFINLISNSVKYKQPGIEPIIEITSARVRDKIQILFKDNGMGIDLGKRGDQVFGLYKRFHGHVDGKGIGLYMVRTQVESLGGKITISSEVNKGTIFTIELKSN